MLNSIEMPVIRKDGDIVHARAKAGKRVNDGDFLTGAIVGELTFESIGSFPVQIGMKHNENSVNPKRKQGNTERSLSDEERVETMYVASHVDEDIVRAMVKAIETGRNDRSARKGSNKTDLNANGLGGLLRVQSA